MRNTPKFRFRIFSEPFRVWRFSFFRRSSSGVRGACSLMSEEGGGKKARTMKVSVGDDFPSGLVLDLPNLQDKACGLDGMTKLDLDAHFKGKKVRSLLRAIFCCCWHAGRGQSRFVVSISVWRNLLTLRFFPSFLPSTLHPPLPPPPHTPLYSPRFRSLIPPPPSSPSRSCSSAYRGPLRPHDPRGRSPAILRSRPPLRERGSTRSSSSASTTRQ